MADACRACCCLRSSVWASSFQDRFVRTDTTCSRDGSVQTRRRCARRDPICNDSLRGECHDQQNHESTCVFHRVRAQYRQAGDRASQDWNDSPRFECGVAESCATESIPDSNCIHQERSRSAAFVGSRSAACGYPGLGSGDGAGRRAREWKIHHRAGAGRSKAIRGAEREPVDDEWKTKYGFGAGRSKAIRGAEGEPADDEWKSKHGVGAGRSEAIPGAQGEAAGDERKIRH